MNTSAVIYLSQVFQISDSFLYVNVKTGVIPVIIGATGTISKSFRKYVSNISRNQEVKELQKRAIWALHTYFGKY